MLMVSRRLKVLAGKLRCSCFYPASVALALLASNALSQTTPVVITQPQGQTAIGGSNVTLWVTVADGSAPPPLPSVSSGTLKLWLKGDAGVITNSSGQVSQWQDQSGNANQASQTNTNSQPQLVYREGLGGRAALWFDGSSDAATGDYLVGSGDVGVPNALTAFAVYNDFYNVPEWGTEVWFVGQPAGNQSSEGFAELNGAMDFTSWPDNYLTSFGIPTNTYRICTDRVNTNLSLVEMFDTTASNETAFSNTMTGQQPPTAGYFIGGFDPLLPGPAGNGRCFSGDISEVVIYRGYLSDADRLAVQGYLQQKYYLSEVNSTVSYQWQFDGTNIAGATNATLALTSLQTNESGSYSVIVTNVAGSTTSSNAVVTVFDLPAITVQPLSQETLQGSNVVFSVTATGTPPLTYQWYYDGATLTQSTNSTLTLTNIQAGNGGAYTVAVNSPYGSVLSSNAVLTVDLPPIIQEQTQSQAAIVGTNITLSVTASETPLPAVSSGTLQLWLKADAGVVTNSAGLVSQWQDQSGNANDASQGNANSQPTLVYPAGIGGSAAVRFNGILNAANGDYLEGTEDVGVSNAMTAFTVYNAFSNVIGAFDWGAILWLVGQPEGNEASRGLAIWQGLLDFTTWPDNYQAPFIAPTNTYRICTDRVNTNLSTVELFDSSAMPAQQISP